MIFIMFIIRWDYVVEINVWLKKNSTQELFLQFLL